MTPFLSLEDEKRGGGARTGKAELWVCVGGGPDTLPAAGLLGELVCLDGGPPKWGSLLGSFVYPSPLRYG